MGLSPKPTSQKPLKGWNELDSMLQASFKIAKKNGQPSATINSDEYSMSTQEIVDEAVKQGYTVKVSGSFIDFK